LRASSVREALAPDDYLGGLSLRTEEAQQAFFDADPRGPSHLARAGQVQETDPNWAGFAAAGANGGSDPERCRDGLGLDTVAGRLPDHRDGAGDAREAFTNAANQIVTAISGRLASDHCERAVTERRPGRFDPDRPAGKAQGEGRGAYRSRPRLPRVH